MPQVRLAVMSGPGPSAGMLQRCETLHVAEAHGGMSAVNVSAHVELCDCEDFESHDQLCECEHEAGGHAAIALEDSEEHHDFSWMVSWKTCPLYYPPEAEMYRYALEADGGQGGCFFECVMSIAEQCHAAVPQLTIQPGANITRDWATDIEQSLQLCKIHLEHEHEHLHKAGAWILIVLVIIYVIIVAIMIKGYSVLRRKHELAFTEAKLKGLVKHVEEGELRDMRKSIRDMERNSAERDRRHGSPKVAGQIGGSQKHVRQNTFDRTPGSVTQSLYQTGGESPAAGKNSPRAVLANAVDNPLALPTETVHALAKFGTESINTLFSFFFVDDTDPDTVKEMGLDAAMYMCHMRLCGRYWLMQFCSTGIVSILVYQFCGQDGGHWIDLYSWSYANLRPEYRWVTVLFAFWMTVCCVIFVTYRQKQIIRLKQWGGHNEVRSATTLWFEGVRPELTQREIADWFHSHCPGTIASIKVALDVHELGKNVRAQRRIVTRMNYLNERLAPLRNKLAEMHATMSYDQLHMADPLNLKEGEAKILSKLENLQRKLAKLQPLEPTLRNQVFEPSGNVFVTFTTESSALSFRTRHSEGKIKGKFYGMDDLSDQLMQNGVGSWQCCLAPMPAEIYWENMGLSKTERFLNEMKGAVLTFSVFMLFIGIACVAVFFLAWDYFYYLYGLSPQPGPKALVEAVKGTLTPFGYYAIGGGGFAVGLLVFEEFMSEIIEHFTGHERPVTQSRKQVSYQKKAYWFYVIFHLVLSTVAFYIMVMFYLETTVPIRLYVDMCGLFHMNRALLTCAIVDPFHMLEGLTKFRRASKEQSEEERCAKRSAEDEEDMLYHAEHEAEHDEFFSDEFDYSKNYGETIAIFTAVSYYATMHPLIMLCASIYFYVKYVIDKYQVRRSQTS